MYNEWGEWEEDEDPLRYADYENPDGSMNYYADRQEPEPAWDDSWVPVGTPAGIPEYDSVVHYGPGSPAPSPGPSPTVSPAPSPSGGGSSGGGSGGGGGGGSTSNLLSPFPRGFQRPTQAQIAQSVQDALGLLPARPEFQAPEIPQIDPWTAPSEADMYRDPSFNFRRRIGEQALENSQAARGVVRSGGSLKDLLGYNQNFASQEYGNIANRSLAGWRGNTEATLARAGLDQSRARSMYEPQFAEYQNKVAVATRQPELEYDRGWREFLTDFDIWKDHRDSNFDKLAWMSDAGND